MPSENPSSRAEAVGWKWAVYGAFLSRTNRMPS
jgi:hypothetical protein